MNNGHEHPTPSDEQRASRLFPSRGGTRMVSMAALVERIINAFSQEHADNSPAVLAAETKADFLKLIRDTVNYVVSIESITLSAEEQAEIVRQSYAELFAYGPLDILFEDETITTIAIEGIEKVSVRRGHGELEHVELLFEDYDHFSRIVRRLLRNAGTEVREDQPYVEIGLAVNGRRVCINCVAPPIVYQIRLDMRLHPKKLPALDTLVENPHARLLLAAIAHSPHGFIIAGETESGKTTLMAMLLDLIPQHGLVSVERAGELALADDVRRFVAQWAVGDEPSITFGQQIANAMDDMSQMIVIDEIRSDEPESILPLLDGVHSPRMMWVFRGSTDGKRLTTSLNMTARRSAPERSEEMVKRLHERLPFVITIRRRKGKLQIHSIAEWQFPEPTAEYADYIELMGMGWEGIELMGRKPERHLDLQEGFWE